MPQTCKDTEEWDSSLIMVQLTMYDSYICQGKDGRSSNSLRGIKDNEFVDILEGAGTVDLSTDVDFAALRRAIQSGNGKTYELIL